MIMVMMMSVPS